MSAQFEAEIRNSIQALNGAVARLSAETERANTGMRNLGTATKVAAAGAEDVGRKGSMSLETMAKGATRAGGEMGKMFGAAGAALGGLNPIALATGMGIGFITGKVFELIQALGQAGEAAARVESAVAGSTGDRRAADRKAVLGFDTKAARDRFTPKAIDGLTDKQQQIVNDMLKQDRSADDIEAAALAAGPQGAFGRGLSSEARASIRDAAVRNRSSNELDVTRFAEAQQRIDALNNRESEYRAVSRGSGIVGGGTTSGDLTSASSALASEVERAAKAVEEARRALEAQNARGGRWSWESGAEQEYQRSVQARDELKSRIERRAAQDY